MGRSNETFNKKEKEKKRFKKQQEKKEKAEARKANSDKGKDLEDMLAYIDADGNITSTPPDGVRKPVLAEDIKIATPKQVLEPEDLIKTGVVSFYNTGKGFGFIRDDKSRENIFFHVNNLTFEAKEDDKVSYTTEKGPKGLVALSIQKIK